MDRGVEVVVAEGLAILAEGGACANPICAKRKEGLCLAAIVDGRLQAIGPRRGNWMLKAVVLTGATAGLAWSSPVYAQVPHAVVGKIRSTAPAADW